jgi:hypothetical protein
VGYGAWHAGCCYPLDHEGPAGHALRLLAIAADGVAQSPVVGIDGAARTSDRQVEYVAWDDRMHVLIQPCGAVLKGSAPFNRLITDARFANKLYSD